METNKLYDNMIYIDGDMGFVLENGKLTNCYDRINRVIQYEDSNHNLCLKINYDYFSEYDHERSDENDVFQVSKFEKIKVVNREVIKYEFNI